MDVEGRVGPDRIEAGRGGVPAQRATSRETVPSRLGGLLDAGEDEPVEGVEIAFGREEPDAAPFGHSDPGRHVADFDHPWRRGGMKAVTGTGLQMIRPGIRRVQSVQRPVGVALVKVGHGVEVSWRGLTAIC